MTPFTPTPRPAVSNGAGPPVARPAAAYPVQSGQGVAAGKGLTFHACGGDVFWRDGRSGGGSVYCTPQMIADFRLMLFQESLDGAQLGDMNLIRSAHRLLCQLNEAQAKADQWRAAGRAAA